VTVIRRCSIFICIGLLHSFKLMVFELNVLEMENEKMKNKWFTTQMPFHTATAGGDGVYSYIVHGSFFK